jgi:hypothetical protein
MSIAQSESFGEFLGKNGKFCKRTDAIVMSSMIKEIDMINNLYQIARERQAEMRAEAKIMRNSQKGNARKSTRAGRMLSMMPAFIVVIIVLVKFLG